MLSIKDILDEIRPYLNIPSSEPVNLQAGLGRVLANDVQSRGLIPPNDICNVDGYAFNIEDLENFPSTLTRVGKSKPTDIYVGEIDKGETIQVFRGCPVPKNTNTIISENVVEVHGKGVTINDFIMEGENISTAGIDINDGDIILKKGTILTSRHIALADITDVPWLPVIKRPRIGIITNMDYDSKNTEFMGIQQKNGEAISSFLSAFINARGGKATNLGTAIDISYPANQILAFKNEMKEALESVDMLVTIGGLYIADENLLWTTLTQQGANLKLLDVAIGHGEKIVIGHKGDIPIIGLPDHHVASLLCALLFLKPALDIMLGIVNDSRNKIFATLDRDLDEFDKATDYLYAKLKENEKGDNLVSPISAQDTLMISVLTETNCLIVVDKDSELKAGSSVEVIMFTGSIIST